MTLWQQPAQLLPVRVRPIGGETLVSYVFRLAAANALARPTTLLRALGEPINGTPSAPMIHNRDVTLNAPALARLETFTGLPADQLRKALPSLSNPTADPLPHTGPTIRVFRSAAIRDHCHACIARIPGRPQVRVHDRDAPSICRRHRRWIETTSYLPDQIDLSENIEIITAHRRLVRLRSTVGDHAWVRAQLRHASWIVLDWHLARAPFSPSYYAFRNLHTRWDKRAATLPRSRIATTLVVMPEIVTLAEILCDLEWRRHVAMADDDHDVAPFYHHVGRRLGQPERFGDRLSYSTWIEPLKSWVIKHRTLFRTVRAKHWKRVNSHRPYDPHYSNAILPTIRHFK
ncbi:MULTISPECIES: TniQ family protein [unclassified Rhodococcus (in: high G+C Gram-positive bacteria)]|jgi:hypothetical protein|uniref:TniQ family protein n=1 Tax=unclassified Rhodococcus (in: high G+C Gram-positive bacteria) TaxID=192944 RepID=UPI00030D348C|nr:TniQ family protein [Rhodococcus sp. DK17]